MEKLQSLWQPDLAEAMLELTPSCCCQIIVVLCPWRWPSMWAVCKARKQELAKWSHAPGKRNQPLWCRHWPCFVHCSEKTLDYFPWAKDLPNLLSLASLMWQGINIVSSVMQWKDTLVTHPGTRCEYVSSWAPLNRLCSALGFSQLPATGLGSGMAATAPSANAGGTEHSGDTHSTEEMGQDLPSRKDRKGHRAQPFPASCSRRHRPRLSLHEEQSPLDGNHTSRMAKIPAKLLRFSSLEQWVEHILVLVSWAHWCLGLLIFAVSCSAIIVQ